MAEVMPIEILKENKEDGIVYVDKNGIPRNTIVAWHSKDNPNRYGFSIEEAIASGWRPFIYVEEATEA